MSRPDWCSDLEARATRIAHMGISEDLASLSALEAWQLFPYLRRLAETQATG